MKILQILKRDGRVTRRPMRNCDTVTNYADAKGRFKAIHGATSCQGWGFNRELCEWLLAPVADTEGSAE